MKQIGFAIMLLFVIDGLNSQMNVKCVQMISLLNENSVQKKFQREKNIDSIVLVDVSNLFPKNCASFIWGNSYVRLTTNKDTLRSLKKVYAHGFFYNKPKYFVLKSQVKNSGTLSLSILHAYSNVEMVIVYRIKNDNYELIDVSTSVY